MRNRNRGKGSFSGRRSEKRSRLGRCERQTNKAAKADLKPAAKASDKNYVGELRLHRDGYGFVVIAKKDVADVFIPARFMGDAMHGDEVEVRVIPGRSEKLEGRIVKIASRRMRELMGRFERYGDGFMVVADDRRVRHRIFVQAAKRGGAKHGDNVIVEITRYPEGEKPMCGEVLRVLGARGEEDTEKAAVIARQQLRREFPEAVQKNADAVLNFVTEEEICRRVDLRNVPFVTIDGESSKDFDDAVAVKRIEASNIRLWVSIADVSFFVRPNTVLDKAAYERGTSVYFPGDCIPMLPEQLSNNLCSLRPNEDKFTFTAEMDVGPSGKIIRKKFYRSVIKSKKRMTYTEIRKILLDRDVGVRRENAALIPEIELMEECYNRLRGARVARGSIDFDLPEPEIIMDMQGGVEDIVRSERHVGHMLIEDFMIAANEAVAEFLTEKKVGCVYRAHEIPPSEKVYEFVVLLHNLGYKVHMGAEASPKKFQQIVDLVHGKPEERLVNHTLLRTMSRAVYSPENLGHFGLASKCYCHFTSPIRRYPDLVVHRLLASALNEERSQKSEARSQRGGKACGFELKEISEHCSKRERVAMEAEREMAKLYAAFFMQQKVGETFEGIISHVTKFGFFVELIDYFVEGIVHIDALADDQYFFEEKGQHIRGRKKKKTFKIGDKVKVEVTEVDIPNREISFELA